jgi:cell division protein FtsN
VPEGGLGESAVPGRVYVPPPAPPPTPPDGEPLLESAPEGGPQTDAAQQDEAAADSTGQEESRPDERPPARDEGRAARTPQPAPQPSPEPRPRARPQPRPAPPPAEPAATYSLQVGVFTSLQGARQVVDELARTGYPARIVPEKRGSQELYRVLTGRYQTEYAARKALDRLRADGFEGFLVEE